MSLTPREKALVSDSFLIAAQDVERLTTTFYTRLFEVMPAAQMMFRHTDMQAQGLALTRMLDQMVESLNHPTFIQVEMTLLSQRHSRYGVSIEHFQPFGETLIWTLAELLGSRFTHETRQAWQKAYQLLVDAAAQQV